MLDSIIVLHDFGDQLQITTTSLKMFDELKTC